MKSRSKTFASKLLWLFSGTVIVCWLISSALLVSILGDYTKQVRDNQRKWLGLYTRTFVQDIRVGNTLSIRNKMKLLIESESYLSATLRIEAEQITERSMHAPIMGELSWFEGVILGLFPPPRSVIPLKDAFQVKWGEFEVVADPRVFYHGVSSTIATYIIAHLGLLLVFLGLLILSLRRQILPLQQLTRSVSFFANSDVGSPEDLEKVLKHPVPGASEELVVLKSALEKAVGKLLQAQTHLNDQRVKSEMTKIALQVAHDIRSPLCVLKMMTQEISRAVSPDQLSLVSGAIEQIQSIAEDLLSRYRKARVIDQAAIDAALRTIPPVNTVAEALAGTSTGTTTSSLASGATPHASANDALAIEPHPYDDEPLTRVGLFPELVARHVESACTSARMEAMGKKQFRLVTHISPDARWAFASIDALRFKRALSNVLKNAIEAIDDKGEIEVRVDIVDSQVRLMIDDNGPGVAAAVMHAFDKGEQLTTKPEGHGLGLQYVREFCESVGGSLQIARAKIGGASLMLSFPLLERPKGIVPSLRFPREDALVVLDDDPSMHAFWREKLKTVPEFSGELHCFSRPGELFRWMNSIGPRARESMFLIDLELGDPKFDGVRILEQLDLWKSSVLVSAREEKLPGLAEQYETQGLRMLPKSLLSWVPIQ